MDEQTGANTAAINSKSANYAVVDRIRDLAKWLVLVFGAIGGVLLTGVQLSDLGSVEGAERTSALHGLEIAIAGAAIALASVVWVLSPVRLSLEAVQKRWWNWLVRYRAETSEPERLHGHVSVTALITAKKLAETAESEAINACETAPECGALQKKREIAGEKRREVDNDSADFLSWVLCEKVRWRMKLAIVAIFLGSIVAAGGIVKFTWETNSSGAVARGEAVPKRASGVTVYLTNEGRKDLVKSLGRHCGTNPLRAVALGGPPDALEMVSVPTSRCLSARFTLTPSVGTVTNEKRLRALRACNADLEVPCVVYRNTPASVVAEQMAGSVPADGLPRRP